MKKILLYTLAAFQALNAAGTLGKASVKMPLSKTDHLIQQRVEIAEKIFQETKRDFNRFLSEVL
jgi:hypothetical protein